MQRREGNLLPNLGVWTRSSLKGMRIMSLIVKVWQFHLLSLSWQTNLHYFYPHLLHPLHPVISSYLCFCTHKVTGLIFLVLSSLRTPCLT